MAKKAMAINLAANIFSFFVSLAITFFIYPYIINAIGKEIFGYLGLANNFTNYLLIITVSINSLAGRFITISIHKNKEIDANEYFNSVLISNLIFSLIIIIPMLLFIMNLQHFLKLPSGYYFDIKMTFIFVFINFLLNLIFSVFSVATFATNKIYLASLRTIESNVIRIIIVLILFAFFPPKILYVSASLLIATIFIILTNLRYTKKLLPQISISTKYFDLLKLRQLIISGMWNSITALSNVLLEGLDLLIALFFISPSAMGVIAITKTIPPILHSFLATLMRVFLPQLTIDYARDKKEGMFDYINKISKITALIFSIPLALIIVFGKEFYSLYLPKENAAELWLLTIISFGVLIFVGTDYIYSSLFNVTNKLKIPALVTLISGALNTTIVLILLRFTNLGVFAIVGVSSLLGILRNLVFIIPYSAKCLNASVIFFYKIVFRGLLLVLTTIAISFSFKFIYASNTWLNILIFGIIISATSFLVNGLIISTKSERKFIINFLKRKFINGGDKNV